MAMTQASTALSIVSPAGAAVGMAASYSMLRSWKFPAAAVALAVAVAGIWNQLANLAFPVVALALLTLEDETHRALQTAALIGLAVSRRGRDRASRSSSRARSGRAASATAPRASRAARSVSSGSGRGRLGRGVVRSLPL